MEREDGTADAGEGEEVPSVPKLPVVEMLYCGGKYIIDYYFSKSDEFANFNQ